MTAPIGSIPSLVAQLARNGAQPEQTQLPAPETRPAIPAQSGIGVAGGGGGGGGIFSPLVEQSFNDRRYYPDQNIISTDGLITIIVNELAVVSLLDARNNRVVMNFLKKPANAVKGNVTENSVTYVTWTT